VIGKAGESVIAFDQTLIAFVVRLSIAERGYTTVAKVEVGACDEPPVRDSGTAEVQGPSARWVLVQLNVCCTSPKRSSTPSPRRPTTSREVGYDNLIAIHQ
jgi:hypothetical protein